MKERDEFSNYPRIAYVIVWAIFLAAACVIATVIWLFIDVFRGIV